MRTSPHVAASTCRPYILSGGARRGVSSSALALAGRDDRALSQLAAKLQADGLEDLHGAERVAVEVLLAETSKPAQA